MIGTHTPAEPNISRIKIYGEESGNSTVKGRAKQTAKEIADVFKKRLKAQGWIG